LTTYRRLATLNATKKNQKLKPNNQYQNLTMNNQELIRILDEQNLFSVVELLSRTFLCPYDDIEDLETGICFLTDEAFEYCKSLCDYERLKLIQLIINTLIHEAEQSAAQGFQTLLPLGIDRVN
jgi:hypothetical protein